MRIIAGQRRGAKLEAVPGLTTRPTADRVKEGLFNVIQTELTEGAVVLDAFAGTGNLGLEALSRGAARAVFIEKDPKALAVLRRNIAKCRFEERAQVIEGDALKILPRLKNQAFDFIFVDPPYQKNLYKSVIFLVMEYQLLAEYGILITEHSKSVPFLHENDCIELYKTKSYGDTLLNFFRRIDSSWREM